MTECRQYDLAGYMFPASALAKAYVRSILHKYPIGEQLDRNDQEVLLDVLRLHPKAEEKFGAGADHLTVESCTYTEVQTRHFVLHRRDGSGEDFSYIKCLDSPQSILMAEVLGALQQSIKIQLQEYKKMEFQAASEFDMQPICPITDASLEPRTCFVDYERPRTLRRIMERWLMTEGLVLEEVDLVQGYTGETVMGDQYQERSWQQFHRQHARLMVVSKDVLPKLPPPPSAVGAESGAPRRRRQQPQE